MKKTNKKSTYVLTSVIYSTDDCTVPLCIVLYIPKVDLLKIIQTEERKLKSSKLKKNL